MGNFRIKTFVSIEDVKAMCELDKKNYKTNNQVDFETCKSWYDKNPKIYTAITHNNKLIGYINFMPITEDCYNRFKSGELLEQGIMPDDILVMEPNNSYNCLFSSVVVDKKYQNTEAFTYLISSFYRNMLKLIKDNNIKINTIIADCVNKRIEEFVLSSGFKKVLKNKNYNIYEGNIFNK